MNNPINNSVFDSRDLIEYKEYLESELVDLWNDYYSGANDFGDIDLDDEDFSRAHGNEVTEYQDIESFIEELEGSPDFEHGESIISEHYFTEYTEDFVNECGYITEDIPWWIESHIDWDGVAGELKADYMEAEYNGDTYYIRA